ncbi:precorrin-6y C5,15-methyltransferase (decarboxylating) subunit CbiE [Maritimibacter sp. HL-12]|uniref:precorrin-6y C5,15-methyltransferase (decarboxylating) subunit CbiE n=1 Tax=Maritimibacter sp. HL-12 TaxID=1162418 RepID=UPI000A0F1132|nr:precorrin-6y C5,15-methyltransferase (decarboxylating) subunit CbiE [Maritimibacter sp. HL-12]SMH41165.1 precorrin-6Y C5,15-methyltransferase (decarboxylating) [Maritimibacter sp. HL-12]
MTPWLHIIGIGADGMGSLAPAARAALATAEVIVGGERHHTLTDGVAGERIAWPSPFDALIDRLRGLSGRRVAVLATGDPLWFSVGAKIANAFTPGEFVVHPQLSAFQLAAARMGWSLADCETLTAHGRPPEQVIPYITPGARLLILTTGSATPGQIAGFLAARGYGPSRLTVLANMGAADELRIEGDAENWTENVPDFNTLAVEVRPGHAPVLHARTPGLPDSAFASDGTMTKREVRAVSLARLMPMRGALLWDIGCGAGSVAIEWMRAARDARAIGIEPRADRRAFAAANAATLGTPGLTLVEGSAPDALAGLPDPDAVFLGGGITAETFETVWNALKPQGRLVANSVTLESEAVLLDLHARHGGELARISVSRAEPVGPRMGWRPMMAVTQWSLVK